jgi:hypothetical protein
MIQYCQHRVNNIQTLNSLSNDLGVEFDIRDYNEKLILNHDPFLKGELFENYVKTVKDRFMIVNVKSEGLEIPALNLLKKYKKTNYFFLDLSFPALVKLSQQGEKNLSARFSKYEPVEYVKKMAPLVTWVWADFFEKEGISQDQIKLFHDLGLKVCIVSPELLKENPPADIKPYALSLLQEAPDMVCTKRPDIWKEYFS